MTAEPGATASTGPSPDCITCGRPKEATRVRSLKCRSCDASSKTGRKTASKRLTLDLPLDVWDRLDIEAQVAGKRIAGYAADLIIARDARKQK